MNHGGHPPTDPAQQLESDRAAEFGAALDADERLAMDSAFGEVGVQGHRVSPGSGRSERPGSPASEGAGTEPAPGHHGGQEQQHGVESDGAVLAPASAGSGGQD